MKKIKQRVTVFERKYNGTIKLWLNYRVNGQRFREPLNLYLDPSNSSTAKIQNLNTMRLAEKIAAQKSEELAAAELGIQVQSQKLTTFADYASKDIEKSTDKAKNYREVKAKVFKLVMEYAPNIRMVDWNRQNFKGFIDFCAEKGHSNNTIITHATILKGFIHRAHLDGIIAHNPDFTGLNPKRIKSKREFLTIDEVRRMAAADCPARTKQPFMFSCFTGLRRSDLERLKWSDIQDDVIVLRQYKTKEIVRIPLSANAKKFLPPPGNGLVFKKFPCRNALITEIGAWLKAAGITKHITMHCARHTFATLLLSGENATDIFMVSKLLGHTNVNTTAIYTHALDEGRKKAVDSIPEI